MTQLAVVYETSLTTEPNPTPAGGEIQSREARGESDCPPFPLLVGDPPQMPPPRSWGSIMHLLLEYSSHYYRFLPIFLIRSTRVFLHDYFSN